jgi:hypothetical protein
MNYCSKYKWEYIYVLLSRMQLVNLNKVKEDEEGSREILVFFFFYWIKRHIASTGSISPSNKSVESKQTRYTTTHFFIYTKTTPQAQ